MRAALVALCALAVPSIASADAFTANYRDGLGTPAQAQDVAAAPWSLSPQGGQAVCAIGFGTARAEDGVYPVHIAPDCAQLLPAGVTGWKPVTDGLALVGSDTNPILDFNRVAPGDMVATRAGAPYLELKRR